MFDKPIAHPVVAGVIHAFVAAKRSRLNGLRLVHVENFTRI
jgi:hypothetical protein